MDPSKVEISKELKEKTINIALAGNPNVGKSVIFNQLTGLSQTIGNWPGKTVERMEGHFNFLGYNFNLVDLPGIYSLSTFSLEEIVSREYIVSEEVDVIINVIDATNLERNLFFTFQLLELKVPMIIAINQMDILRKRNKELNFEKLESIFKLPVLPVVAIHGKGVHQLLEEVIELVAYHHPHSHYQEGSKNMHESLSHDKKLVNFSLELKQKTSMKELFQFPDLSNVLMFGKEVESRINILKEEIEKYQDSLSNYNYPSRFVAIKLLEHDEEIEKLLLNDPNDGKAYQVIIKKAEELRMKLEEMHGEDIHTIISSEIYGNIREVVDEVLIDKREGKAKRKTLSDKLDHLTTHSIWGYVILGLVLIGIYSFVFFIANLFGGLIEGLQEYLNELVYSAYGEDTIWVKILWDGGIGGFFAGVGGVLLLVIPFFFVIEILQDSGYLPRAAFLMDRFMHSIGVHGKTIIPMILGMGCNVPACAGCRIMETEREKKLSIALTSVVPCAAVMTVVIGLVGTYLGLMWVIILYGINLVVLILIGRILNKTMPGECTELIMEMHEYRMPNYGVIIKQTWLRSKEFIIKALPLIIVLGVILEILFMFRILDPINVILSPITVLWLGLPLVTGIFLIYGILRKELTLTLLLVLANSMGMTLLELMTPVQMIVFCLVTMLYIPCFATIIVIAEQTNWKYAAQISMLEIGIALLIGGVVHWSFALFIGA